MSKVSKESFDSFTRAYVSLMEDVLGLTEEQGHDHETLAGVMEVLINLRKKARADRNYALSDRIRDELKKVGVQLKDGKEGEMSWEISD
jgi:cysteinyl-tRNA synthetase